MLAIAHRGLWWPHTVMQNSTQALMDAALAGYAIETDVRVEFGALTIRHGPSDPPLSLEVGTGLPRLIDALHRCPKVFWNIKSLDAIIPLAQWVDAQDLRHKSLMFDMEMCGKPWPEMLGERPLPYLRRASDMADESLVKALGDPLACGVWLDTFYSRAWVDESTIRTVRAMGKAAYVVSPELHADLLPLDRWQTWDTADGICTDFPHLLMGVTVPTTPANSLLPTGWHAEATA